MLQLCVMFLYMFAGYILFRTESITIKGSRDIAAILVKLVIGLAMAISAIVFKRRPVDNFGSAFSNAGFIGIPLIQAAFGDKSVFIALSTPAGANVAVYSQLYDADYPYACQVVAMTALLSIVTFPLMILAASHFGV